MTVQSERALQAEVLLRMRAGGWPVITLAVPNSIYFPARTDAERSIIARVVSQMKNAGQITPGAPDLAVFWRGGAGMIELKRAKSRGLLGAVPAGRPSDRQVEMAERAAALGINHAFCSSWDEVAERLTEWGALGP
jgi:hypothetical protein